MNWIKYILTTTTQATDHISCILSELGVDGIEISDNIPLSDRDKQEMFIDILPELNTDDNTARISFYIDEAKDRYSFVEEVNRKLDELSEFMDLGQRTIEMSTTCETDWINNWKQYFKPFRVYENIIIKPTWEVWEKEKEDDCIIEIDPGTAFGTGSHETTQLCIASIKKHINHKSEFLDIGCGSGILSIIASKLGVNSVTAIDIDPNAAKVTYENAKVNNIPMEHFLVLSGNIIENEELQETLGFGRYDVITANIIANVIIELIPIIGKHLKKNGVFISSGILNTKEEDVKKALIANGYKVLSTDKINDWVSITAQKIGRKKE